MVVNSRKGFTLIELVVAVAIVLVITSIVMINVVHGRARARDQQRIADLNTIAQAMTQYNSEERYYPYWEMTGSKKGIFNYKNNNQCTQSYPCIYDASAGSSWRNFLDNYLKSRPIAPKKGESKQYFYNSSDDASTPPTHFSVGARLESSNYKQNKYPTDAWYTTGYCEANNCKPDFPDKEKSGWFYVVGQ